MQSQESSVFLFPPEKLTKHVELPENLIMRPLNRQDFAKGHAELLSQLTQVGPVSQEMYQSRFDEIKKFEGTYWIVVIEDTTSHSIVATGTLILEKKFTHVCGSVGHIEDIVVSSSCRGQQLGKLLIDQLKAMGDELGVYKIILDCNDKNIDFYEKCGFQKKENCMAWYIPGR
eukprot:TRINITY_DN12733_c0_g1_i1.p1 TRINITY_DN12733_c0_g1~~TRINITY_DN12733_c0_g1_i1.p1  ORF type:complete len:173 (-),score=26.73 TRINITY_DN12733_c0_g1_i1:22-540(-)